MASAALPAPVRVPRSLLLSTGWDAVSCNFVMITLILLSSKTDENPSPEAVGKDRNGKCR